MKKSLLLSGQFRLNNDETISDKLNYFKKYIDFEHVYMQIWLEDYLLYQSEIDNLQNCSYMVVQYPKISSEIFDIVHKIKHHANDFYERILYQIFGIQSVFQIACIEDNDIFIRCRYDCKFKEILEIDDNILLKNNDKPVVLIPAGGDWCGGIGDVFYICNRYAANYFCNYLNEILNIVMHDLQPLHSETLLRTFLINHKKALIYRFPYFIEISSYLHGDNYRYNSNYKNSKFCILDNIETKIQIECKDNIFYWQPNFENEINNFESEVVKIYLQENLNN